jgi:ABC-type antimicrobial peptide transport system permease subunit
MALGQDPGSVRNQVLLQGVRMGAISAALGVAVATLLSRSMASLLYGVKAADPLTFATMTVVLMAVALAGCYVPARRATRVNPIVALKTD